MKPERPDIHRTESSVDHRDITARVHRALTATPPMPNDLKQHIWEDLMSTTATPAAGYGTDHHSDVPRATTSSAHHPSGGGFTDTRLARAVNRWQPAVSLAIVIAFLVSLMGIAYQRGILDQPPPNDSLPAFGQAATPEDPFAQIPECSAQDNTSRSNEDLLSAQFLDFRIPAYSVAMNYPAEELTDLVDLSTRFWACQFAESPLDTDTDPADPIFSFLSERLRYLLMADQLPVDQQAAIDTYLARNPISTIIKYFPLPLNSNGLMALIDSPAEFMAYSMFSTQDVYWLPGDRLAATMGTVSTHMLQTGEPVNANDGEIVYMSFIEENGSWVVDEFFQICPSDFAASLTEDADFGPFDPAELLRNPIGCS